MNMPMYFAFILHIVDNFLWDLFTIRNTESASALSFNYKVISNETRNIPFATDSLHQWNVLI